MNRARAIAVAVSAVTIGALAVAAAPAVASVASGIAGLMRGSQTDVASPAATSPGTAVTSASGGDLPADVPESYVNIGNGTSIPAGGPGDCAATAYVWIGSNAGEPMHAEMLGAPLVDMGPRELAAGTVTLDTEGRPATYVVEAGDAPDAIGDRFCIYNPGALVTLNHSFALQPGQILRLSADPELPFVSLYEPQDAPVGESIVPYRQAFVDMGDAADAGDVDTLRWIWNDRMSALVPNPAEHEFLASAIADGDIDALRQIFS